MKKVVIITLLMVVMLAVPQAVFSSDKEVPDMDSVEENES